MKLSFSTLFCPDKDSSQLVELCKKFDISGVELRILADGKIYENAKDDDDAKNDFYKDKITVTNIGSSVCIKKYDENVLENLYSAIYTAVETGAEAVRIFLGNFQKYKTDPKDKLDYDGIIKALKEGCDFAKKYNKRIWVETHNEFSRGRELKNLINDVNRDNLGIIWDIMHPLEENESINETYEYLGRHIEHIHIKDGKPWDDTNMSVWEYTKLGEGNIPIKDIVDLLNKNGYDGFYSLEWENAWREELRRYSDEPEWILNEFVKEMQKCGF